MTPDEQSATPVGPGRDEGPADAPEPGPGQAPSAGPARARYDYAPTPAPQPEAYHALGRSPGPASPAPPAGVPWRSRRSFRSARRGDRNSEGPGRAAPTAVTPTAVNPGAATGTYGVAGGQPAPGAGPSVGGDPVTGGPPPYWAPVQADGGATRVLPAQPGPPAEATAGPFPATTGPFAATATAGPFPATATAVGTTDPGTRIGDLFGHDRTEDPPRRQRQVALGIVVLLVLLSLLAGILIGGLGARSFFAAGGGGAPTLPTASAVDRAPDSVAGIAEAVLPSTVYIQARGNGQGSSGTGLVLREDGYIVTNNHVIETAADGGRVVVGFPDGSEDEAEIVGRTADYDLAVLRVDRDGLEPLVLADSDTLAVGDTVVAVGAPLGLEGTVTSGIVSALNRPVTAGAGGTTTFINAIQTDAAINPGNSGGPLVDASGQVVGINTAIAQASGASSATGSIGLGFAIPANQVRRTTEQIIATGSATYPVIGVSLDTRYTGEGVQVLQDDVDDNPAVVPGGPGDLAGIRPGDVIVSIDGRPVTDPDELIVVVRSKAPGDTVVLGVRRGGGVEEISVVLGESSG
ncbi:S1C family serine protease [Georgenia daeguensis]|uniref:PDZ domain-containing protein n=1 Tax=Georgenia daeguensis TaxID=908355 RepID=A0ABP8EV40_9MICO